jgi:hypothetical protein
MIAFTVCSNNYLAEALSLGYSLIDNGLPAQNFKIFLVDTKRQEINYRSYPFDIIEVDNDIVPDYETIVKKYRIVELSTSVKPSIFKYLIKRHPDTLYSYFDPDLFFFQSVDYLAKEIGHYSMVLTPHVTRPIPLDHHPFENTFLNYGLYNLGYITLRPDDQGKAMLDWWEERTLHMGYDNPADGLFVDQLWMNLVPLFFKSVKISFNLGLNVSYWNLAERRIFKENDTFYVNDGDCPLIFYHFSSFDITATSVSKRGNSLSVEDNAALLDLMQLYKSKLESNQYHFLKSFRPYYKLNFDEYIKRTLPQGSINDKELRLVKLLNNYTPKNLLSKVTNIVHKMNIVSKYKA